MHLNRVIQTGSATQGRWRSHGDTLSSCGAQPQRKATGEVAETRRVVVAPSPRAGSLAVTPGL